MHDVVPEAQQETARQVRQSSALYEHNRDLIAIGAYHRGSDPRIDAAIGNHAAVEAYLQQNMNERVDYADSIAQLQMLLRNRETAGEPG